ncbi:TonB-dependent receptor [Sphingomonas sp. CGMCC 1.13654]|uniref:TonB-dependent receptor n=2 Tax=Sphingomonas chungangi TaxID=2683589 RepID=A0A838L8G9_9SPHN|nr:TonB-dependent receptor [Sphingomonas chungangi]MVW54444.1 TonB-dependent receptor plug domain-containing protein [Sphingomonas chungangi]
MAKPSFHVALTTAAWLAGPSCLGAQTLPEPSGHERPVANNVARGPADATSVPVSGKGIADIVVTAQRRNENLQRAAVAVTAVGSDELMRAGVSQPQDLTKLVPALKLAGVGGGGTQVTVRGVGNFAGNPYAEPAVAVNLDGVYLARSGGPDGLFYDLDRVEVLKGPQGTLYGRNATAGAINIITKKPTKDLSLDASLEAGNYGLWRGMAALNVPVSPTLQVRASGTLTHRDGYSSDGYNDDKTQAGRLQLRWLPTARLSVLLVGDYEHVGGKGPNGVFSPYLVPSNPFLGSTKDGSNALLKDISLAISGGTNPTLLPPILDNGFVDQRNWGTSATIDLDLGGAKLTVLPAYRHSDNDYLQYNPGFPVSSSERSRATSIEARLTSTGHSPLQWIIGGYFYNEKIGFDLFADQGVAFARTEPLLHTRSYAAFGQLSYAILPHLRATGGLRYTDEHKTQAGRNGGPLPALPAGYNGSPAAYYNAACQPYDPSTATCYFGLTGDLKKQSVTWKAGLEYDAGPRSLIYGNVATGFKAGGFFGSLPPNSYKPETLTAYTLGTKNRFFDNSLQVNAEAFYWTYKNKQVTHLGPILPSGFNLITENAGKATIKGAELEIIWQPTHDDAFSANLQYLHARYKDFRYSQTTVSGPPQTACPTIPIAGASAVTVDCSGRPLPLAPTWTANLSYRHTFELRDTKIDAQIGTQIQSRYFTGEEYLPGELQKFSTASNASLTWHLHGDRYAVGLFIDNIEDSRIKTFSFVQPVVGLPVVILRAPRTFGGRFSVSFR